MEEGFLKIFGFSFPYPDGGYISILDSIYRRRDF
jgi:hypothetical protein